MNFQSRLPDVGTTIFTVMSKMAQDYDAINLSQGYPDFPIDEKLIELAYRFMREGYNQYAPMPGLPALRNVIASVATQSYGRTFDPEGVTIMAGATEALFSSIAAFVNPGDEVILFDPSYDSYDPAIRLNGGVPVHLELFPPDFSINWEDVRKSVTPKTRMIMINTPHNPTGTVLLEKDIKELEAIVLQYNLIVLSDEVYERIIFDNLTHQSVLRSKALSQSCIAAFSFGKTYHATGWRIGYTITSEALTREIRKAHQFITFTVNTPIQMALAEYMKDPENYLSLGKFYQKKRDYFLEQIKGSSFEPIPSYGSYFQLISYKNISNKPEVEMAEDMTKQQKVACIPISVFYKKKLNQQLLRFCFAKREETLQKAGEILRKL